jgi:hypothetical protein
MIKCQGHHSLWGNCGLILEQLLIEFVIHQFRQPDARAVITTL